MTTITITGVTETQKGIDKIMRDVKKTKVLLNRLGRAFRQDARTRITTQNVGSYPKLSKWTRARTGRRKAFVNEKKNITFRASNNIVQIGHNASGWSLADHEKGFTTPGFSGMAITIPLKNPKALRDVTGHSITIRGAKESVVPARRVFATKGEGLIIIKPIAETWIKNIVKRSASK